MLTSMARFLKSITTKRVRKQKPKRTLLRLEALEDRKLLSNGALYNWSPITGGGNSWTYVNNNQSNWLLYGTSVRATDYPGAGSNGFKDVASFGVASGDCTLANAVTISGLDMTGYNGNLTLNSPLTVAGYSSSGTISGSFKMSGNITKITIGSQDANGNGFILKNMPTGNAVWRSGTITDTTGGGAMLVAADSTAPCELDITGIQPPQPAGNAPTLGASMVISGNSSTNTATVSLSAMTGSGGSNLQVTSGVSTDNSITAQTNGKLILAQSNTTLNADKYGGIDFATQQTTPGVVIDGGSLLRTLGSGGAVEINNAPVLVKNNGTITIGNGSYLDLKNSADSNGNSIDLESGGTLTINDTGATNGRLDVDHNILAHGGIIILYARTGAVTNLIQGISSTPTITIEGDGFNNGWIYVETTASLTTAAYATVAGNVVFGSNGYYAPYYLAAVGAGTPPTDVVAELSVLGNVSFNTGSFVDLYTRNTTQPDKTRYTPILQSTGTITVAGSTTFEDQGSRTTDTFINTVTGVGTEVLNTKCTGP